MQEPSSTLSFVNLTLVLVPPRKSIRSLHRFIFTAIAVLFSSLVWSSNFKLVPNAFGLAFEDSSSRRRPLVCYCSRYS